MKRFIRWGFLIVLMLVPIASVYGVKAGQTIFRVYINDMMVGVLSDSKVYDEYKEQKMREYLSVYDEEELIIPENIRIEEEYTFIPYKINDEETLANIDQNMKFKTKATTVKIGETSLCVKDITEVEREIESLIKVFVSDKDLEKVRDESHSIEPLKTEGSQVIGVKFEPKLEYSPSVCNIDDLVQKQEIGNIILTGDKVPTKIKKLVETETVEDLADNNEITLNEFKMLNYRVYGSQSIPYVGQEFNVSDVTEAVKITVENETVKEEIIEYVTETINDPNLPVGELHTKQEGHNGVKLTTYNQTYVNGELTSETKINEQVITEAQNRVIVKGSKVIPNRGTGNWKWPTTRYQVSCGYLCYGGHYAIDISAYVGQPIFAADNGVVIKAGWDGGYGYSILINHNNGYYTRYAHMSSLGVAPGQVVAGGQNIGAAGNTGNSSGPHLHFEIRTNTGSQPSYAPNPMGFY